MIEFKTIPQFPAYRISECGTIVVCNKTERQIKLSPQIIKGKETGYIYCAIIWKLVNDNKYGYLDTMKRVAVHRLVAYAWLSDPPTTAHVWINHKDGNKANNHKDNLEWSTISQNIQHAYDNGLKIAKSGQDSPLFGRKASIITRMKQSLTKLGAKHPKFNGVYIVFGKRFESANQAGLFFKISPKTIYMRARNPKPKFKDYSFIPKEHVLL